MVARVALLAVAVAFAYPSATNPGLPAPLLGQPQAGPYCFPKSLHIQLEVDEMQIAYASHVIWANAEATGQTTDPAAGGQAWNEAWAGVYPAVIRTLCQTAHAPIVGDVEPPSSTPYPFK